MNRIDTKFIVNLETLNKILPSVVDNYYILEVENNKIMEYKTTYYDTKDWKMFNAHQNSKLNRHKIRRRDYILSDTQHLEVKFKNNKKLTKKSRIKRENTHLDFTIDDLNLIERKTPYNGEKIEVKLKNHFQRIMLIHKYEKERVTIDSNISFTNPSGNEKCIDDLIILEIKRENKINSSVIFKKLKNIYIRELRISKYILGSILLYPQLKSNNYKKKILAINKILSDCKEIM